jgi:hypothetical protein
VDDITGGIRHVKDSKNILTEAVMKPSCSLRDSTQGRVRTHMYLVNLVWSVCTVNKSYKECKVYKDKRSSREITTYPPPGISSP